MKGVSEAEAIALVRRMIAAPGEVEAVQAVGASTSGPVPFFIGEAEVTLLFYGGVIEEVVSVRIDRRFSNSRAWDEDILDMIEDAEVERLNDQLVPYGD
jgi:hypothetical protein